MNSDSEEYQYSTVRDVQAEEENPPFTASQSVGTVAGISISESVKPYTFLRCCINRKGS